MRCVVTWGIIQDARDRTQVGKANNALQMRYCSGANTLKKKKSLVWKQRIQPCREMFENTQSLPTFYRTFLCLCHCSMFMGSLHTHITACGDNYHYLSKSKLQKC